MGVALILLHIISIPASLRKFLLYTLFVSLDVCLWKFEIARTLWSLVGQKLRCPKLAFWLIVISPRLFLPLLGEVYLFLSFNPCFFGAISQRINEKLINYANLCQRPSCLQLQHSSRGGFFNVLHL